MVFTFKNPYKSFPNLWFFVFMVPFIPMPPLNYFPKLFKAQERNCRTKSYRRKIPL